MSFYWESSPSRSSPPVDPHVGVGVGAGVGRSGGGGGGDGGGGGGGGVGVPPLDSLNNSSSVLVDESPPPSPSLGPPLSPMRRSKTQPALGSGDGYRRHSSVGVMIAIGGSGGGGGGEGEGGEGGDGDGEGGGGGGRGEVKRARKKGRRRFSSTLEEIDR